MKCVGSPFVLFRCLTFPAVSDIDFLVGSRSGSEGLQWCIKEEKEK